MWNDPLKEEFSGLTSYTDLILGRGDNASNVHGLDDKVDPAALERIRWIIAGITFGIFVIVTIGIAVSHYVRSKRFARYQHDPNFIEDKYDM